MAFCFLAALEIVSGVAEHANQSMAMEVIITPGYCFTLINKAATCLFVNLIAEAIKWIAEYVNCVPFTKYNSKKGEKQVRACKEDTF